MLYLSDFTITQSQNYALKCPKIFNMKRTLSSEHTSMIRQVEKSLMVNATCKMKLVYDGRPKAVDFFDNIEILIKSMESISFLIK